MYLVHHNRGVSCACCASVQRTWVTHPPVTAVTNPLFYNSSLWTLALLLESWCQKLIRKYEIPTYFVVIDDAASIIDRRDTDNCSLITKALLVSDSVAQLTFIAVHRCNFSPITKVLLVNDLTLLPTIPVHKCNYFLKLSTFNKSLVG